MALGVVAHLSQELGPRASGTEQERKAAQYLVSQLEQSGYSAWLQEFTVTTLSQSTSSLTLESPDALSVGVVPLSRSSTGEVKGRLVPAGLARPHELPAEGLAGNIALVERGLITFQEKVDRLAEAGAVGAVIYNNAPGNFRGTLREAGPIPVVSISQEDGARIQELVAAGTVEAVLTVNQEVHPSQNVIAEKPGGPDAIGVVVLGAHYDTVPDVPGANDNASGTAVLLTLAEQLQNQPLPFTVRFIGFGSEELGLRGSRHYLDSLSEQQRRDITAMLNFDSLGSGESLGVLGDSELVGRLVEIGKEMGIDVRSSSPLRGGSSDHASFQRLGIPAVMFVSRDSSRIHTSDDTLEHVNARLLGDAVRLALGLLESGEPLAGKSP
ncbi:MAG: M20/M25/M40 family metallo-hydrolase [Chloroflexi bacterium]|nr:M20/M25/M40 family metallo-hydrolase [Chloroflexota bacterium]